MRFDESTFLGLSGLALGEYAASIADSGYAGLDPQVLQRLLERYDELSDEHVMELIRWGVRFEVPRISDIAVAFLNRDEPWHGPHYRVLQALLDAGDLTQQHVEAIVVRETRSFLGAKLPNAPLLELIDDLRRKVAGGPVSSNGAESSPPT